MAVNRQRLEFKTSAANTQHAYGQASAALEAFCALGEACTAFNPAQRPTASDIVFRLQMLLDQSEGSSSNQPTTQDPVPAAC